MEFSKEFIFIAAGTGLFFCGFVSGYAFGKLLRSKDDTNWGKASVSLVVPIAWFMSIVFDILVIDYSTPVAIHAIMGLVTGYFYPSNVSDFFRKK